MSHKTAIVLVTYRRLRTLTPIIEAWLKETPDVWLADCSAEGYRNEKGLKIKLARFQPDPGSRSRHALAMMTEAEFVIKADDDLVPQPGLLADFEKAYAGTGLGILGLIGRRFLGPSYYKDTQFFKAAAVKAPVEVDFVGVTTYSPRAFLGFDLKGCTSPIEDLFWQMKAYPGARKWVIPTTKYMNLPASHDSSCLFHDPKAREEREAFYGCYFRTYYQERKPRWTPKNT